MERDVIFELSWWLMECSLPDLNWARLRVPVGGPAEVLDQDGSIHRFPDRRAAVLFLTEDEFVPVEELGPNDLAPHGLEASDLKPPIWMFQA